MATQALLTDRNYNNRIVQQENQPCIKKEEGESALQWLAHTAPKALRFGQAGEECEKEEAAWTPVKYARRITADFKKSEINANQSEDGEVCYDYQAQMQHFEIIIRVNGDERKYLIKGIDGDGKEFEKEFDPYHVDPEHTDYTEFTALCLYIQKTDGYADSIMRNFAHPDDILEKQNYVSILNTWEERQGQGTNMALLESTRDLLLAIRKFMEERAKWPGSGSANIGFTVSGEQAQSLLSTVGVSQERLIE